MHFITYKFSTGHKYSNDHNKFYFIEFESMIEIVSKETGQKNFSCIISNGQTNIDFSVEIKNGKYNKKETLKKWIETKTNI